MKAKEIWSQNRYLGNRGGDGDNSLDVHPLVDLAVSLRDEVPSVLEEELGLVLAAREEEVVGNDLLGEAQALLGALKVELGVQPGDELRERVLVLVGLALNRADNLLERVRPLLAGNPSREREPVRDNDGKDEVAEEVRARRPESREVRRREEELEEEREALRVVEENEERPVEEPAPGLELSKVPTLAGRGGGRGGRGTALGLRPGVDASKGRTGPRVDEVLEFVDLLERVVPGSAEDVGRKLAPVGREVEVEVRREDEEVVEVLRRAAVVSVGELELAVMVEGENRVRVELQEDKEAIIGEPKDFCQTRAGAGGDTTGNAPGSAP